MPLGSGRLRRVDEGARHADSTMAGAGETGRAGPDAMDKEDAEEEEDEHDDEEEDKEATLGAESATTIACVTTYSLEREHNKQNVKTSREATDS
jgi:hypothetical protein